MSAQSRLHTKAIESATIRHKPYKLSDGGGLYLLIRPNGSKYWRLKHRFAGRECVLSLGVYPTVGLAQAPEARDTARTQLAIGRDPMAIKRKAKKMMPKPTPFRARFRLSLSDTGRLTIETQFKLLRLSTEQTGALRAFLLAADTDVEEVSSC